MNIRGLRAGLVVLLLASTASVATAARGWQAESAARDSFRHLPPNMRFYALRKAGLLPAPSRTTDADTGSGLRLIGKWGAGPSVKVTGRDSLVFLSRGSEVVAINFADTANPHIISYIQAQGLVSRSILVGNRLYVGSTGSDPKYVEVFDVTDPANVVKLGQVQTMLNDIAVKDTLVYTVSDDSFKVFSFADPVSPTLVGACRDSGYSIAVNAGYAYLGDRWGLYVVDATNPANPHRVASWGSDVISVTARNTICCVTLGNPNQPTWLRFTVLDIADPSLPMPLGSVDSCGGYDIFLKDSLAFLSGYYTGGHEFRAVCIADSTHPLALGQCRTDGQNSGVWAAPGRGLACVADGWSGLAAVDISSPGAPILDTVVLKADQAQDIAVDDSIAYVADYRAGLKLLDVSNLAVPSEIGCMDTTIGTSTFSCAARDSFAYMGWANPPPFLRAIDVTDPTRPSMAGGSTVFDRPQDMVLRDSLLYVAQRVRFQIINVARPREPVLVGSCVTQDGNSFGLAVQDTLAYLISGSLQVINVARPASPTIVSSTDVFGFGVAVRDTFVYVPYGYDTLRVYSASNPQSLRLLGCAPLLAHSSDVALGESLAVVATVQGLELFSLANPAQPQRIGSIATPCGPRRVVYSAPYWYVAMWEAGVAIYETTATAVAEAPTDVVRRGAGMSVHPSPTRGQVVLELPPGLDRSISVLDAAGRSVLLAKTAHNGERAIPLDLSQLKGGVYFIEVRSTEESMTAKVVKN